MRILYLHQYYRTPLEGGGIRSYHVAQALAERGHDVHVVTTWDGPARKVVREGRVLVTYLPIRYSNEMDRGERIRAFFRFVWGSYEVAKAWLPADRVFATSTPLTIGLTALLLKVRHGIPFVFEVRDAWPEAPIQLGYVQSPFYKSLLRGLERRIYAQAQRVIALSPAMAEHVKAKWPRAEVRMVPNFSDLAFFHSQERAPLLARESGSFHLVYAGTLGYANDVMRLLRLAQAALEADLPVRVTIAGEGGLAPELLAYVKEQELGYSVKLLPHLSSHGVRDLLVSADAAYVGFRPEPVLAQNSPNKFFDALAAGIPVLLGVGGWLADQVREAGSGIVLADYGSDVEGLRALMESNLPDLRANALELAQTYERGALADEVAALVVAE